MRDSSDISGDNTGAGPNNSKLNRYYIRLLNEKWLMFETFQFFDQCYSLKFFFVFSEQPLDTRHSGPSQSLISISLSYVAN